MPGIPLICRTATPFKKSGELDPEALEAHLQRMIDSGHGVYLASGASGEGHALTVEEIREVYRLGVAVCQAKVPVGSNQPEQHTARDTIAHAQLAVEAKVDHINLYGPEGRHGYRPSDLEYRAYFDTVLREIRYPVALAPNPAIGYRPSVHTVAAVVDSHPQIVSVNLAGIKGDAYFVALKDALTRDVDIFVPFSGSQHMLEMGATGLLAAEANIIPKSLRSYLDHYERGELGPLADVYAGLVRFTELIGRWNSASPRWIKLAMRALGLPGSDGGVREPYLMPDAAEVEEFRHGGAALGLPEITAMLPGTAAR
jgi:dihydrodipicolinate synthase/N-acetylneuraminate lyase